MHAGERQHKAPAAKGFKRAQDAKMMEVLVAVQGFIAEPAMVEHKEAKAQLAEAKAQLGERAAKLTVERGKVHEAQVACDTVKERLEEAFINNEELRELSLKEKIEADARAAKLASALEVERKALEEERAKMNDLTMTMASERAAYPDLYIVAVEQFKQSTEFQIAVDVAVARSLARKGEGDAGPSNGGCCRTGEGANQVRNNPELSVI